ncbi:MAG: ArsC/Spx/MgsR family protein [Saprospiraceae bacterium]
MNDKIFILKSCSTCQRIIKELGNITGIPIQNIKELHISSDELTYAKEKIGSYESLFNKRAMKYKSSGLNKKEIDEKEWENLILNEYTFIKRPLAFIGGKVFFGNSKKVVADLKNKITEINKIKP